MVISYLGSSGVPKRLEPRGWSTEWRMWKNWLTLLSSSGAEMEFKRVKAALTKREPDERSPGRPWAPRPWQ